MELALAQRRECVQAIINFMMYVFFVFSFCLVCVGDGNESFCQLVQGPYKRLTTNSLV